ncbi:MAG: dsbD [Candidatus Aminicenantes bacterium]|nr:dsbD [Candidatus Aminicenantes bacterium]
MRKIAWTLIIMAAFLRPVYAQVEEPIVKVEVVPSPEAVKPGQTSLFILEIAILSPYHINADQPTEDYLIGTAVDFKSVSGVSFGRPSFPPAEMKRFSFSEKPLAVFEGRIQVKFELALASDFKGDEVTIEGAVGYQACNDESCLAPDGAAFHRTVRVEGTSKFAISSAPEPGKSRDETTDRPTKAVSDRPEIGGGEEAPPIKEEPKASTEETSERSQAQSQDPEKEAPEVSAAGRTAGKMSSRFEGKALLPLFLLVFLGGLALNLTPCVYPLIPITISYFGGQAEGKKGGTAIHAGLYVIGMAATYSVLGSIAAFTGSLFGAALQYPAVLLFIAAILVLLSLSMFDVYELRMPAFLNRLAGGSQRGYLGTFFMGLTVGIVAAPCIGPFVLGLLTYVGNRGSVLLGFSLFFVLALGLGVPFLFLGMFSGSLSKLPRSGAWMVWVRKIFGFILLAMAVYFLKTLFPTALLYHLALAMILFVAGLYLAWLEPTQTPGKAFRAVRTVVGIVFFGAALLIASSGIQAHLDEAAGAGSGGPSANAIAWEAYSEAKLADALSAGRPVFIDSFADWCIPCKEMDKRTFSRPEVIELSREFAMLKADLTSRKDPGVGEFYEKYRIKGVPTLIFIKPDGTEMAELRGAGFEPKDVFLAKMKRALVISGKR